MVLCMSECADECLHLVARRRTFFLLRASVDVGVYALYGQLSSPQSPTPERNVFWHLSRSPILITPTQPSCLFVCLFFLDDAKLVLLLARCHTELCTDLSLTASLAFFSL